MSTKDSAKAAATKEAWQIQPARYALLSEVVLLIAKATDLDGLLTGAINKIKWVIDFERCTLALLNWNDEDTYGLQTLMEARRKIPFVSKPSVPVSQGLPGEVMRTRQMRLIRDLSDPDEWQGPCADPAIEDGSLGSVLSLPLQAYGRVLGCITFGAGTPNRFDEEDAKVAVAFATHLALAIDRWQQTGELQKVNETLRLEMQRAEQALADLKEAQANLVHAEKMASLGQLTAGIAHEIKNPLNFVNNFAQTSIELLGELREVVGPGLDTLGEDPRGEAEEIFEALISDLDTISNNGRRADGIVKNMLLHSRGGVSDHEATDVNAAVEESLNLAYHGERARDSGFNIAIEHDFDPEAGAADLLPQEISRVLVNLFGNSFYATCKRKEAQDKGYEPTIKVATRSLGDAVEIRVRDNGIGMSEAVRKKLFTPFFTTKPTGEGTGLGLSLSYDIITQQHKGSIIVESEAGAFTEIVIRLPRQFGGARAASKGTTR